SPPSSWRGCSGCDRRSSDERTTARARRRRQRRPGGPAAPIPAAIRMRGRLRLDGRASARTAARSPPGHLHRRSRAARHLRRRGRRAPARDATGVPARHHLGARCLRIPGGGCGAAEALHRCPGGGHRRAGTHVMSESRRAELWSRWYAIADHPSPLIKQSPTAIAVLIAVGLSLAVPELTFEYPIVAWFGVAFVAVATGLAVILTGRHISDGPWVLAVPVVSVLALGLFRAGTGGADSLFGILVLLPIVWIASLPGFRHVLIVGALTILAIAVPYFTEPVPSHASWLRVA